MQVIGLSKPVYQLPRTIRNQAQHKHGADMWRSIYYREQWDEPWQQIARSISRLKRWAIRKYNNPPSHYRRLKAHEAIGEYLQRQKSTGTPR